MNEQINHASLEARLKKPRSVSEMVLRASATLVISKLNPLWRVCADEIGSELPSTASPQISPPIGIIARLR
jgi:hypothetical protein